MLIEIQKDTPTVPFNKHWQFCIGSPHATYALRRDYFEQLKQVHQDLKIERVRFHGIFCDDMHTYHKMSDLLPVPGASKYSEQSFRWCGVAYDNVLAAGMKPFVELSFMPKALAKKNRKGLFFYKPNISPPKDYNKWYAYIQEFIRFLIDRYGIEEVRQWYFEVWNEPDLKLPFFAGSREDYFKLYAATVKAIKDIDSGLQVGGPSTSGSKWVKELLAYCRSNSLPIDFVTTHEYAGDPLGGLEENGK
ncbi:MAG: beta-xylosidase, partial [Lachnospiraceae bacterium]